MYLGPAMLVYILKSTGISVAVNDKKRQHAQFNFEISRFFFHYFFSNIALLDKSWCHDEAQF